MLQIFLMKRKMLQIVFTNLKNDIYNIRCKELM